MKLRCFFIFLLLYSCGQSSENKNQDSHITMPEKDKDGEKGKDKEDFGRLMEKLGGKDFVDNMKTSSEKLLNSNLEKEQENAVESDFLSSDKPVLEWFPDILLGTPDAYEHFKSQFPALKEKIDEELKSKSLEEKEAILQNLYDEFRTALPKNHRTKYDFRMVAWFMESFAPTVNADVIGDLYTFIIRHGDLVTWEHVFENNFSKKHAFNIMDLLGQYSAAVQNLSGKSPFVSEIGSLMKESLEKAIRIQEAGYSPSEREKFAQNRRDSYAKYVVEQIEPHIKREGFNLDLTPYFPLMKNIHTIDSKQVGFLYRIMFAHGNFSSRQRLLSEFLEKPQATDLGESKTCPRMQSLLELSSGNLKPEEVKILQTKLEELTKRFEAENMQRIRARFIALEGMTPEEFKADQERRHKRVLEILGESPYNIDGDFNEQQSNKLPTADEAIEHFDERFQSDNEHAPLINLDFSDQVKDFLPRLMRTSEEEKQRFFESVVFRGGRATLDAIVKPLFGFSISEVEVSVDEIKEFLKGKKLPEALKDIRTLKADSARANKLANITIAGEGGFVPFYKKIYFAEGKVKEHFNYLHILKEIVSHKDELRSPKKANMIWELVFESVQHGDQETARFAAERLNLPQSDQFKVLFSISGMDQADLASKFLR